MGLDVLIPTYSRPRELALTLAGLAGQEVPFTVIIADQNPLPVAHDPLVETMVRILEYRGHGVDVLRNPAKRGIAQQRDLLFAASTETTVLMLDDDVWLAPGAIEVMSDALETLGCGFVGMPVIGLSHLADQRPDDLEIVEWWDQNPTPEVITPDSPAWQRYRLHNAANPAHLVHRLQLRGERWRAYRVAWIGGCVLYQRSALQEVGGWSFWSELPEHHAGEDVLVQLRVLAKFAGAGLAPSYAFHHEVPTTLPQRDVQAYDLLGPLP